MAGITIEPARFAMTGPECGITQRFRNGYDHDDAQALDAPEYIARGSLLVGHEVTSSVRYVSTSDPMQARMHGVFA